MEIEEKVKVKKVDERWNLRSSQEYNKDENDFVKSMVLIPEQPRFSDFQETISYLSKNAWYTRIPQNHKEFPNFNIFHFMSFVQLAEQDKKPFTEFFNEVFAGAPQDYLFDRVDYAKTGHKDSKISPLKIKPKIRPLDFVVINKAYFYSKLIVEKIILTSDISKIYQYLYLTAEIFDDNNKEMIRQFSENRKIVNFIILNELLKSSKEFKNKLIKYKKNISTLIRRVFKDKSFIDISQNDIGKFIYSNEDYAPEIHRFLKNIEQDFEILAKDFLGELFKECLLPEVESTTSAEEIEPILGRSNSAVKAFSSAVVLAEESNSEAMDVEFSDQVSKKRKLENEEQYESLKQQLEALKSEKENLEILNAQLQKQNSSLQERLNTTEDALRQTKEENDSKGKRITELEKKNEKLTKENDQYWKRWDGLQELFQKANKKQVATNDEESNAEEDEVKKKFDEYITPREAAELYFSKYKNKKENKVQVVIPNSNPPVLLYSAEQNVDDLIGLWGEQAVYEYMLKKCEYNYHVTRKSPKGVYTVEGFKEFADNHEVKKCYFNINIEFPNKDQYEKAKKGAYSKKPGDYDIKITRTLKSGSSAPTASQTWLGRKKPVKEIPEKIRFIEVKSTPQHSATYAFFTKNEHRRMQDREHYIVNRIYGAGKPETQCKKIKNILEGIETDLYKYQLKVEI